MTFLTLTETLTRYGRQRIYGQFTSSGSDVASKSYIDINVTQFTSTRIKIKLKFDLIWCKRHVTGMQISFF